LRFTPSHGFEVRVAALVELVVGVAHGFRLAATQHHLHVDRLKAVVLTVVDQAAVVAVALR
jgi:hypothetical protein